MNLFIYFIDQLKHLQEIYDNSQERCKQLQNELNALKERSGQGEHSFSFLIPFHSLSIHCRIRSIDYG